MTSANEASQCGCQSKGIAILPVRYTVVPKYLNSSSPAWANLTKVTSLPLNDDYQYHVRILREGFLYLYIPEKLGSKWQVYTIDSKGHLFKQHSNAAAKPVTNSQQQAQYHCPQLIENENHNTFITLSNPESIDKVYIAFSEIKWSEKTRKKYEANPDERMQMIDLARWEGNAESATVANHETIQTILDFDTKVDRQLLPYDENKEIIFTKNNDVGQKWAIFNEKFSKGREEQYQFNDKMLDKNSTCEPWSAFKPDSSKLLAHTMERYSTSKKPMIFAIEDPVGITTELNGYYNEAYIYVLQYQNERRLEYEALGYIEEAKKLAVLKKYKDDYSFPNKNFHYIEEIMKKGSLEYEPDRPMYCTSRGLEALIREQLNTKPGGYNYYSHFNAFKTIRNVGSQPEMAIYEKYVLKERQNRTESTHTAEVKPYQLTLVQEYRKTLNEFYSQESSLKAKREQDIKKYLQKYDELVNTQPFENKHEELIKKVELKYNDRSKQLITWIRDSNFYFTVYNDIDGNELYSFDDLNHPKFNEFLERYEKTLKESLELGEITSDEIDELQKINIEGILFVFIINKAIKGLELCEDGKKLLNSMTSINYAKPDIDNVNGMLWRVYAYHNDKILNMIDQIITEAELESNKSLIETSVDKLVSKLDSLPYAKIALNFKKLQDVIISLDQLERSDPDKVLGFFKVRGFSFGEEMTAKATKIFQPIFNLLADSLYSVSTAMYKALSLTTAGVFKSTVITFMHLEYQLLSTLTHLDPGPNFGTPETPIYHSRWEMRKRAAIEKGRLLLNDAVVNLERRVNIFFNRTISQNKANKFLHFIYKASDAEPGISKNLSHSLKSMRIAGVVAMLELYNFTSLSKTYPNLEKNEYFSALKTSAGFALAAASFELMAMVTAVSKGVKNVIFSLGKALSGVLGGIAQFLLIYQTKEEFSQSDETSRHSTSLKFLLGAKIAGLLLIGSSSILIGSSYHYIWCRSFLTNKTLLSTVNSVRKIFRLKKISSAAAMRLFLFRLSGIVGVLLIVLDIGIYLLTDDNLETWLKRCALRTDKYLMPHNKAHIYQTPEQQTAAFNKDVLKDMFNIENNEKLTHDESYTIDISEALALIEQDLDERGFLNG